MSPDGRHIYRWVASCALTLAVWMAATTAAEIIHFDLKEDGAATLVIQEAPDGRKFNVLIDAGRASKRADVGAGRIRAYLNERGIRELDAVILTHIDADHAQGIATLVEELAETTERGKLSSGSARGPPVRIRQVIWPGIQRPTPKPFFEAFLRNPVARDIEFISPETGADLRLEPFGIRVQRMRPEAAKTSNDTSLILTVADLRTGVNHLLTGDMTARSLAELRDALPRSVEVLNAPHHGADTTVIELLERTSPKYLVVSANRGNRHRHPPVDVLRRIARFGHNEDLRALERQRQTSAELVVRWAIMDRLIYAKREELRQEGKSALLNPDVAGTDFTPKVEAAERQWRSLTPAIRPSTHPVSLPVRKAPTPLFYDQVLITGEVGDVRFLDGTLTAKRRGPPDAFLREMIWYELRYTNDADLRADGQKNRQKQWAQLQGMLGLRVARRLEEIRTVLDTNPDVRPLWFADVERIVAHVRGWSSYTGAQMDTSLRELTRPESARDFARARVSEGEWVLDQYRSKRLDSFGRGPFSPAVKWLVDEADPRRPTEIDSLLFGRVQRELSSDWSIANELVDASRQLATGSELMGREAGVSRALKRAEQMVAQTREAKRIARTTPKPPVRPPPGRPPTRRPVK